MPDVRHGCAAQSLALTVHGLYEASIEPARPGLRPQRRGFTAFPLTTRAPFVIAPPPAQLPRLPRTQPRASNGLDGSPTLARRPTASSQPAHPVLRGVSGPLTTGTASALAPHRVTPRGSQCPASFNRRQPAQHHLISPPAGSPTSLTRSSATPVFLNPPRFHSAVPNPGMQWTRCARH